MLPVDTGSQCQESSCAIISYIGRIGLKFQSIKKSKLSLIYTLPLWLPEVAKMEWWPILRKDGLCNWVSGKMKEYLLISRLPFRRETRREGVRSRCAVDEPSCACLILLWREGWQSLESQTHTHKYTHPHKEEEEEEKTRGWDSKRSSVPVLEREVDAAMLNGTRKVQTCLPTPTTHSCV